MATQKYRAASDRTVGLNETTPKMAPGHAPEQQPKAGAENKTPAPVRPVDSASLELARSTAWGHSKGDPGDNPGKNGYGGPSSVNPGQRAGPATVNPLAPTDAVLENVIRGAEAGGDDWQTRAVSADPHPTTFGTKPAGSGSPSGTVPAKTGFVESAPVRKPGA